jgi:AraC-like DNA-binding protein
MPESDQDQQLEKILPIEEKELPSLDDELMQIYKHIQVLPFEEIRNIARMLSILCNYILDEAIEKKRSLNTKNDITALTALALFESKSNHVNTFDLSHDPKWHGQKIDVNCTSGTINLRPIFAHLHNNPGYSPSEEEAAKLCNLSVSYFSRLFKNVANENYSTYCLRAKIEFSKRLLVNTDMTINQIGEKSGFCDSSHYIRTFKRFENITPTAYQKRYK